MNYQEKRFHNRPILQTIADKLQENPADIWILPNHVSPNKIEWTVKISGEYPDYQVTQTSDGNQRTFLLYESSNDLLNHILGSL